MYTYVSQCRLISAVLSPSVAFFALLSILKVRDTIKNINRNKDKTWAEKQSQLHQYVQSLPAEQKALLMSPPPPPPPHGK